MTDLERRALMGDKKAQEECTEKGIVLPCPVCYKPAHMQNNGIHERSRNSPSYCADYNTTWKVRCEWCGHESYKYTTEFYFTRESGAIKICGDDGNKKALKEWNTRTAPPIGKCGECKHSTDPSRLTILYGEPDTLTCHYGSCNRRNVNVNDFCSYFEPRCEE